tara:strand:+ start:53165 stop:54856 length:1692 start_codon:yes stop_codon:yes gene_type:complete
MRISSVTIHNYRGIIDAAVTLCNYSIVLGANNAGKSTFLAAICAFYDHDQFKYKKARDWPHESSKDEESWVEIEFSLTQNEASSLKAEYLLSESKMIVRRYLFSETKAHDNKNRSGAFYAYTKNGLTHEDFYYGTRNVGKGKLGNVIYIPAVSRVEDHTKLSGPSALRDLLNDLLKDIFVASPSYEALSQSFEDFGGGIRDEKTAGGRSLNGLQDLIQQSIASWGVSFSIEVRPPDAAELVKSLSDYTLKNPGSEHAMSAEEFGSGFQRNFIYSLINVKAAYVEPKKKPVKKTFAPDLSLLLFEEPEAFLHPPQQEKLSESLRELAESEGQQVVCSTHSPNFVSYNSTDLKSICRFYRAGAVAMSGQLTQESWDEIVSQECGKGQEDQEAVERIKYFLWLNPDRCGALFSDLVLLVEGTTDQVVIRRLVREGRVVGRELGLHVLDSLGKYNIPRFSALLSSLNIKHSILFDEDAKKQQHTEINTKIRALIKNEMVQAVVGLPNNLEKTLGLPAIGRSSQKPAAALHAYENNEIDENLLSAFCGLINGCLQPAAPANPQPPTNS